MILNPNISVWYNWASSCVVIGHLVVALRGTTEFSTGDYSLLMRKGRVNIWIRHVLNVQVALEEAMLTPNWMPVD